MLKISSIIEFLEEIAPPSLQESYDNSGLQVGNRQQETRKALLTLDCTEAIVEEAIQKDCNLIIAHHPVIFGGIKSLTGKNDVERTLIKALKHDVAIYAIHTNLDNVLYRGVNEKLAQKLKIKNLKVLQPKKDSLSKLVVFVPVAHLEQVQKALWEAGAGHIGNYDQCSFAASGKGTFRALEGADPFVGRQGELHTEPEERLEVILPRHKQSAVVKALLASHPYEEVAYELYPLLNTDPTVGSGAIGELEVPVKAVDFPAYVKQSLEAGMVKHTPVVKDTIKRVAICGGSGSFLLPDAIRAGADAFVTADYKYHQYFDAGRQLMIVDPGHYETEKYTPTLLQELLIEKFPTFAPILSELNTNPINYI